MEAESPTPESIRTPIEAIIASARQVDRRQVAKLTAELGQSLRTAGGWMASPDAKRLLHELRRKRFFREMQSVAEALIESGQDAPVVRRQHAQALIDTGSLTAAAAVLRELIADTAGDPSEQCEARGLLGRVLKQQYVTCRRPAPPRACGALVEAIRTYEAAYRDCVKDRDWHGINTVACVARARRDGLDPGLSLDERELAAKILGGIEPHLASETPAPAAWDLATALEACVALGDTFKAKLLAREYVAHAEADAFELGGTLRQLTEVWQLDQTGGIGGAVLPILREALLKREDGQFAITPGEVGAQLEAVHGNDGMQSHAWYVDGLKRARLVAQLRTKYGTGFGTGFLVRGEDLTERLRGRQLLLTNAHVVSDVDDHWAVMQPDEAIATFEATAAPGKTARQHTPLRLQWVSGPEELDTAVFELTESVDGITDDDMCNIAERLPASPQKDRIYIIGHPSGRSLSYSLQDNLFLGSKDSKLHYRTPTEPGSSGSPVFDQSWQLIGIHHAGDKEMPRLDGKGSYGANEGISIHAIREAIAKSDLRHPT